MIRAGAWMQVYQVEPICIVWAPLQISDNVVSCKKTRVRCNKKPHNRADFHHFFHQISIRFLSVFFFKKQFQPTSPSWWYTHSFFEIQVFHRISPWERQNRTVAMIQPDCFSGTQQLEVVEMVDTWLGKIESKWFLWLVLVYTCIITAWCWLLLFFWFAVGCIPFIPPKKYRKRDLNIYPEVVGEVHW